METEVIKKRIEELTTELEKYEKEYNRISKGIDQLKQIIFQKAGALDELKKLLPKQQEKQKEEMNESS